MDCIEATIDFSPNPCARNTSLSLQNIHVSEARVERFVRVWHNERRACAPKLDLLHIHVEGTEEDVLRFLRHFQGSSRTVVYHNGVERLRVGLD